MTRIIIASFPGEAEVAAVDGRGDLIDFALWRRGAPDGLGDVHAGRITARVPLMAGTFVAIAGTTGFLPDSQGGAGLAEGTAVTVRVTRAASGGKGPRLSARDLPQPPPVPPPALLAPGPTPVARLAARHTEAAILTDDAGLIPFLPASARLDRDAVADRPVERIEALAATTLALPEGPVIRFHPTPALVAIDADTAAATAARGPGRRALLAANRAVILAVARHIRLRELSGAIVVDLAGLSVRVRAALAPAFHAALAADPAGPRFLGFTALGLAEIVRPRLHPPLHELRAGPLAAALAALRATLSDRAARVLRAAPALLAALAADAVALDDLARLAGRSLIQRSDPSLAPLSWRLES